MNAIRSILTPEQQQAHDETVGEYAPGYRHLFKGPAGTGKTTTAEEICRSFLEKGLVPVSTAPTHKAVRVSRKKLKRAGLEYVDTRTIQSLLTLRPRREGDRQIFVRAKRAKPVTEKVVLIDECSMVGLDLMVHIRKHLPQSYVIFIGDDAQLNPIGEELSETFSTKSRSELSTIMRQAEGNPILQAALEVRRQQSSGQINTDWVRTVDARPMGLFRPSHDGFDNWMRKGFTSDAFKEDPDSFRHVAWRNATVDGVNLRIRRHLFGSAAIEQPFMVGERCNFLEPLILGGETTLFATGEEPEVMAVAQDIYRFELPTANGLEARTIELPSWRLTLKNEFGDVNDVHAPRGDDAYQAALTSISADAAEDPARWEDFHNFKDSVAKVRPIYSMTVHASQGSTFKHLFLDVRDILANRRNTMECLRLLYTGLTRPSHTATLRL